MKFVQSSGGLGNQMFIYSFCLALRTRCKRTVLLTTNWRISNKLRERIELDRVFKIEKYQGVWSKILAIIMSVYLYLLKVFPHKTRKILLRKVGVRIITVSENFVFYPQVFDFKSKHEIFSGTWQSEKFFFKAEMLVKRSFIFNTNLLSENSKQIWFKISNTNSVSIHIRRGDYLSDYYIKGFGGICTYEYYSKAMDYINKRIIDVFYYVFTDDKEWVFENYKYKNSLIIDFNLGKDSWQDMFLMSKCKHNIIANSSFSWWGAWLNDNPNKIVIAPKRWWSSFERDDVVPESWIRL